MSRLSALARWRAHLEEVMGVDDAAAVLDPFETVDWATLATTGDVDQVRSEVRELRSEVKELRRDLIRVTGAQFFALIAAVAALVGLQ